MAISERKMKIVIENYFKAECNVNTSIREAFEKGFRIGVKKGQSAQRPEQRWISVTERLPEEKKDVLIAFKHNMAVGFWEDILDNGEPVWYANSGDGWMTDTETVDSDGIPIAWMPLPEPYAERGQE